MPRREINTHKVNGANEAISITVLDEPGSGGASHKYLLQIRRPGPEGKPDGALNSELLLQFQNGPIGERGPNGITQEALLAVVIDRLECFQRGPFKCKENEDALGMIKGGATCLHKRTTRRLAAGVEGTHRPDPHIEVETPLPAAAGPVLVPGSAPQTEASGPGT